MYYLKCFILYSILGFVFESVVYKVSGSIDHSGVLCGPYTFVYGLGGMFSMMIYRYIDQFNVNTIVKYIILFLLFTIICTLIEYVVGHLIHLIFNIDKWNYSNHKYHFGKYICLDYAFVWGILAFLLTHFLRNFFDNVMLLMTNNTTWIIFAIMIIDLIYSFIIKRQIL